MNSILLILKTYAPIGINFAKYYILVIWNCGSFFNSVVVDRKAGEK